MSVFHAGNTSSVWLARPFLAVIAIAYSAHPAPSQTRDLIDLPNTLSGGQESYTRGAETPPLACRQSAGQSPAEQSAPPSDSQTGSASLDQRDRVYYPGDTESIKPLARKLFLNILLDQKDIFTSPFRMDRHSAKWWLLSGAVTAGLIASDHHIANSF